MYTTITKTNGIITFANSESSISLPETILQKAKITKSGGSVIVEMAEYEKISLDYNYITAPVVTSADTLITALNSLIGLPIDATIIYGVPVNAVAAQGTLTLTAGTGNTILNNKTVTVGGKIYTFKTALTPTEGEVLIGLDDTAALLNLKKAINHEITDGVNYKCASANANVVAISSDATTLIVENKVKGTIGNRSIVDTDIAGAWDDTALGTTVLGVNGTVGSLNTIYKNNNSIYFTNGNTINDANWVEYNADMTLNGQIWTDVINEATDATGVTVDSVLIKDGVIKTDVGTAALPAYAFSTQANMGMYKSSSTELGFAASGEFVARISKAKGITSNLASINQLAVGTTVVNNNTDPADKAVFAADIIASKIFTGTPVGNILYTLPTGTQLETANASSIANNYGLTMTIINLSGNTITLTPASAATIVGVAVVAANTSAQFRAVRAGTNTFVFYRL